jgi:hypothetical protein
MRRSGGETTFEKVLSIDSEYFKNNRFVNATLTVENDSLKLKVTPHIDSFEFTILNQTKKNAAFNLAKKFLYSGMKVGMVKSPNKYYSYFGPTKDDAEKFLKSLTIDSESQNKQVEELSPQSEPELTPQSEQHGSNQSGGQTRRLRRN